MKMNLPEENEDSRIDFKRRVETLLSSLPSAKIPFAKGDPAKAETIRRRIENAKRSVDRGGKDNVVFNPKTGEIIDPKTGEVLDAVE